MKYYVLKPVLLSGVFFLLMATGFCVFAEEPSSNSASDSAAEQPVEEDATEKDEATGPTEIITEATEEIAQQLNQNEKAKKYSAGILEPIYALAEYMSFSSFYWIAFAFMVSGVISFALQLVLAKLAVLMRGGLSVSQILTDAQGLVISLIGLFLTTQAATENSDFATSPAAVLSATAIGVVAGFLFYLWGQSAELQALIGRRVKAKQARKKK